MDSPTNPHLTLRTSVLEAAIQLGAHNETVARWLFSNDPADLQNTSPTATPEFRRTPHNTSAFPSASTSLLHSPTRTLPIANASVPDHSDSSHNALSTPAPVRFRARNPPPHWTQAMRNTPPFSNYDNRPLLSYAPPDDPYRDNTSTSHDFPVHNLSSSSVPAPKKKSKTKLKKSRPSTRDGDLGTYTTDKSRSKASLVDDTSGPQSSLRYRSQSESRPRDRKGSTHAYPSGATADESYFDLNSNLTHLSADRNSTNNSALNSVTTLSPKKEKKGFRWGFKRSASQPNLASSAQTISKAPPRLASPPPLPALKLSLSQASPLIHAESPRSLQPTQDSFRTSEDIGEYDGSSEDLGHQSHKELLRAWTANRGGGAGVFFAAGNIREREGSLKSVATVTSDSTLKEPTTFEIQSNSSHLASFSKLKEHSPADPTHHLPLSEAGSSKLETHSNVIYESRGTEGLTSQIKPLRNTAELVESAASPLVIASFGPSSSNISRARSHSLGRYQRERESSWEISGSQDFTIPSVLKAGGLITASAPKPLTGLTQFDSKSETGYQSEPTDTSSGTVLYRSMSTRRHAPPALVFSPPANVGRGGIPNLGAEQDELLRSNIEHNSPLKTIPVPPRNPKRLQSMLRSEAPFLPSQYDAGPLPRPPPLRELLIPPPSPPPTIPLPPPPVEPFQSVSGGKKNPSSPAVPSPLPSSSTQPQFATYLNLPGDGPQMQRLSPISTGGLTPDLGVSPSPSARGRTPPFPISPIREQPKDKEAKYRDLARALFLPPPNIVAPVPTSPTPDTFDEVAVFKYAEEDSPRSAYEYYVPSYYMPEKAADIGGDNYSDIGSEPEVDPRISALSGVGIMHLDELTRTSMHAPILRDLSLKKRPPFKEASSDIGHGGRNVRAYRTAKESLRLSSSFLDLAKSQDLSNHDIPFAFSSTPSSGSPALSSPLSGDPNLLPYSDWGQAKASSGLGTQPRMHPLQPPRSALAAREVFDLSGRPGRSPRLAEEESGWL